MKRLPVYFLVAALMLALVAGTAVLPRFVNAQGTETPAAPVLPSERPVISATLPDATAVEGVLEESCWPQSAPDQQLCQFASASIPTTTITLAAGESIVLTVAPAEPPPTEFLALVYLDPLPANGEPALTVDLTAENGVLNASALPAGSTNFLVAVIASYAAADGGEYYVRSNFKITSDAGTAVAATPAATIDTTAVVSAPTDVTPDTSATSDTTAASATPEAVTSSETPTPEGAIATAVSTEATQPAVATTDASATLIATETAAGLITATPLFTNTPLSAADEATALAQTRSAVVTVPAGTAATVAAGTVTAVVPSATPTVPPTHTFTATATDTATFTATPTNTATFTATFTNTPTPTNTATFTNTPTPTSTFTPTPTPTNTPLAPELIIRVGGRDFAPIRLTVSFTGNEGDAVTVSRANREGSFRVLASPADAAQIIFTGPRPSALRVSVLSSDGLTQLSSEALTPDNLVLYTLPSQAGAYVVAVEVQFSQLGNVKALYYFRLVVQ